MTAADLFGWLATVLTVISMAPQALRLARTRDVHGVAAGTMAVLVVNDTWWVLWGAHAGYLPTLVTNALGLVPTAAALVLWTRWSPPSLRRSMTLPASAALAVGAIPLAAVAGFDPVGGAAVITASIYSLPQGLRLLRGRGPATGVSLATWLLAALGAAAWLAYGLLMGSPTVALPGLVILPVSLAICVHLVRQDEVPVALASGTR